MTEPPRHNLPRERTPFVGRVQEIVTLRDQILLQKYALITLIGEGGMGKTRLALAVACSLVNGYSNLHLPVAHHHFPDGIWFIALAGVEAQKKNSEIVLATATHYVQQVVDFLQNSSLDGLEEPIRVCLLCAQVLSAQGDRRAANLLTAGRMLLDHRSSGLTDPVLRESYRQQIPLDV